MSFPVSISANQIFLDVRALRFEIGGAKVEMRLTGETFEVEDQRNWSDANFKIYGTPLHLPFPVEIRPGTEIHQRIEVALQEPVESLEESAETAVRVCANSRALAPPKIGLVWPSEAALLSLTEIELLRKLRLAHIRVDIRLQTDFSDVLKRAASVAEAIGAGLEVAVKLPGDPLALRPWAIPDALTGTIARQLVPLMKAGATLIMLDAAAAYIGELPEREDITQMIAHPCHPPIFTEQATPEARKDYFGGIAVQDILVSLIHGPERSFAEGTDICRMLFAPVNRALRVTPEHFALLEPAMSEIVVGAAANWMKQSLDLAIEKGVPRDAAEAFIAGHAQIAMAIVFGAEPSPFSDAARLAVDWGAEHFIDPAWRSVYERETLERAIRDLLKPRAKQS